ncbi:DNA primase [Spiroplasma citri]|uniref:DNA primase n=1 Tax=Spiroplasma citri TaxID=2133 RepID=A0AAJ4EIR3_SPICI|nr:DNA primase [Spiroplasma citri]APE74394.1 putative DNA primase [Spiroplasma citri]QIA66599.1 DNA primase [Spiroplasma citri]QIA68481.1 DNA primase [Spiroplasma citri]QIA70357.1 DNA primase [Spiroplasma citri]QIA72593.1 DNA primase [Spiroplasma citri]
MALISNEKIDLIKSKVNIVTVMSEYLSLEKRGRNYWAVCPFHQDSHPSMSISPEKQIYRCFACSAGGNVFTFLQEYENISFIEALKKVAVMANISLDELTAYQEKPKYDQSEQLIFEINALASAYFSNNLETKKAYDAKEYLTKRNINNTEIELFQIGYAESGFDHLYHFLIKKGYSINDIQQAGLITIKNGKVYDYFNNRLMFPIKNEDSYVIGFSGRVIGTTSQVAKYLNTPETKVFKKEQLMYNIHRAKPFIRQQNNLILLEGYMDVISLEKLDIKNTVALMGTNLSEYHLKEIKRLTNECLLFLDGDKAGIHASLKAAIKLLSNNLKVKIVLNKTQQDPDELVNSGQGELIQTMLANAQHPINFALDYFQNKFNLQAANELEEFFNIVAPLIKASPNPLEQELAVNNLVKITGISKQTITTKIGQIKSYQKAVFSPITSEPIPNVTNDNNYLQRLSTRFKPQQSKTVVIKKTKYKIKNLKRYLLAEQNMVLQLLASRKAADFYQRKIGNLNFDGYRLLANDIITYYNRHLGAENVKINMLCDEINDPNLKKILMDIINKSTIKIKYNKKELEDYALLIDDFANEKEIAMLWNKLEKASNLIEQQAISMEIDKLNQRLKFKKG